METKQVTLEYLYKAIQKVQQELHEIKDMIEDKTIELTEEDLEFHKGTEQGWKDIDEGRYETYTKKEYLRKLKEH
mgnify:CR=1 FL=1